MALVNALSPVRTMLRRIGSLLPAVTSPPAASARVVRPWREDLLRTHPTVGITPSRLLALLNQADDGSPAMQFELYSEMLQKWPRLAAVESTRRMALTGLEWELTAGAAGPGADSPARSAAEYCRESLEQVDTFREVLEHLANAIGFGIAVAELVWEAGRLIDVVPVPNGRLVADPNEPWRLRVRTQDEPSGGIALDEQPTKWIVHRPQALPGRNFDGGLLRGSAFFFVAQNLSMKEWLAYSQFAGMPIRIGRFEPGTPEAERKALLNALQSLGNDSVAIVSKATDVELLDAAKAGERPYAAIQQYCNTEITILWLGQHLTTDIGSNGSRAAADVQDRVREDLLVHDIESEGRTIRRDVLTPLVRAKFGPDVPVPHFRRSLVQAIDTAKLAQTLAVAVNELRLPVPRAWAYQALGVPAPREGEPVLDSEVRP